MTKIKDIRGQEKDEKDQKMVSRLPQFFLTVAICKAAVWRLVFAIRMGVRRFHWISL